MRYHRNFYQFTISFACLNNKLSEFLLLLIILFNQRDDNMCECITFWDIEITSENYYICIYPKNIRLRRACVCIVRILLWYYMNVRAFGRASAFIDCIYLAVVCYQKRIDIRREVCPRTVTTAIINRTDNISMGTGRWWMRWSIGGMHIKPVNILYV